MHLIASDIPMILKNYKYVIYIYHKWMNTPRVIAGIKWGFAKNDDDT